VETIKRITAKDSILEEKVIATAVWAAIKENKTKIGIGTKMKMKTKKKTIKKMITSDNETRCILPILLMLGALGFLIGGATKTVNDNKTAQHQLEELLRHNRAMEGHGLYLAPYKYGQGLYLGRITNMDRA